MVTRADFRYRLAAIDIDDTLVGPDKQVSRENHDAIDRLQQAGCRPGTGLAANMSGGVQPCCGLWR